MARIKIDSIEMDDLYIRERVIDPLVDEYAALMRDEVEFPPILVFKEGHHCRLCDGRHRVEAKLRNKETEIEAVIRQGPRRTLLANALRENREQGAPLTAGDQRRAIRLVAREFPDMSQIGIAMLVGCTQGYVSQVLNESEV